MLDFLKEIQIGVMLFVSGTCAVLILLTFLTKTMSKKRKYCLMMMQFTGTLLLLSDVCAYTFRGDVSKLGYYAVRISNFMVFFLQLFITHEFTIYLVDLFINDKKMEKKSILLLSCEYIFTIGFALIVISQFTGLYYTFDEFNRYTRGPGFMLCYVAPLLITLLQLIAIIKYREYLNKRTYIFLLLFITLPYVASIMQMFAYGLSLTNMTFVGLVVCLYVFELQNLNEEIDKANKREIELLKEEQMEMRTMFEQTAEALASSIDAKDKYTHGHSSRVADYSRLIAQKAGKDDDFIDKVYFSALLHDVGKIGVPDKILNKEGKLTDEEFNAIKQHPVIGKNILSSISSSPYLSLGANYHHERYDGKGYPEGLSYEDIPEAARIIGVADAYDAMTSKRSYRDPLPQEKVRSEIEKGLGKQFDPVYGQIMLDLINEDKEYIMKEK